MSPGTPIFTSAPIWIINTCVSATKLLPKTIVLVSTIANPSEGWEVPVFGFWITPSILTNSCAALDTVANVPLLLPSLRS